MTVANPIPRLGAYELYWKFAYERQKVFELRSIGAQAPWTNDLILQKYKFCNVFRATDRVSQFMIRDVCYNPELSEPNDKLFQIVAFRMFSNIDTWKSITNILGRPPVIGDLVDGSFENALNITKELNKKLYTHAFILCAANSYGREFKHLNHVELLKDMFVVHQLGFKILKAKSLKEIYDLLHTFPLMGDFMSYQIAIDLNYSELVNFSENEFVKAGPGSLRGINKVFEDTNGLSPEKIIMWMVKHQDQEFERFGYKFNGLFGRKLHGIDCQGLFCETDKYCRVALPGLASARSQIKTKFQENTQPIELYFPPKWKLTKF